MTNSEEITINLYNKYIVPNYGRFPIMPVKGDGSFLYDEDGTRYLDFTVELQSIPWGIQMKKWFKFWLINRHNYSLFQSISTKNTGELAKIITEEIIGYEGKCFFCNSGAEANEALIKIARKFGEINPGPSGAPRREIISFNGSFHGRTTGDGCYWTNKNKIWIRSFDGRI